MSNKKVRRSMPHWFSSQDAKWFSQEMSESMFRSLQEGFDTDKASLVEKGYDPNERSLTWLKTEGRSILIKHKQTEIDKYQQWEESFLAQIRQYSPKRNKIQRAVYNNPVCLVINPCDPHFGKLGLDYNLTTAKQKFKHTFEGLLEKVTLFDLDSIIFVGGNDVLHTDSEKRTTTSGTPQDTDGMWYDHFNVALECYVDILTKLTQITNVHYVHCMSNHDYKLGWTFSKILQSYFTNDENITFDVNALHRKYVQYGTSLLGFTHGDGVKDNELPNLMKSEVKDNWSQCTQGYWYVGHLHHKINKKNSKQHLKEYGDVTVMKSHSFVEGDVSIHYCHSISGTDHWHEKMGYTGNPKGIDAFVIDPHQGQIAQLTQYI